MQKTHQERFNPHFLIFFSFTKIKYCLRSKSAHKGISSSVPLFSLFLVRKLLSEAIRGMFVFRSGRRFSFILLLWFSDCFVDLDWVEACPRCGNEVTP